MFRWRRAAAAAALAVLALSGCTMGGAGLGGSGGGTGSGSTLTWGVIAPVKTFSAQNSEWGNGSPYLQAVYDTILKADPDGRVQPNLATDWSYNEGNTVLTLTLRDDVRFTDGTPLNADAVAQNLIRFRGGTSPDAANLKNLADAKAVDPTHVQLTLTAPDPAMLTYLTSNSGLVESPKAFTSPDIDRVPVGSGPYTLNTTETLTGITYVFDKNPDYWYPDDQHYEKLVLNVYANSTSMLTAAQGGLVNVTSVGDNSVIPQLQITGFTANAVELSWTGLLLGDLEGRLNPALADVRVRQAINYAFDRDALLSDLGGGYGTVTEQIFPAYSPSYDKALDTTYDYNPAKAKSLLGEAGYGSGLTLAMPSTSALPPTNFRLVAQQLGDVGITVNYTAVPPQDYAGSILGQQYAAAQLQLRQDPTDWQLTQFQVDASSPWNLFHVADATVQGLIGTLQTGDASSAAEAGKELNRYLVQNAWYAPWYRPQSIFATDAKTKVTLQAGNPVPYLWNVVPA
jgi:peptide/nickel transport system substrate-binding protein